jgi:hypothetical protein
MRVNAILNENIYTEINEEAWTISYNGNEETVISIGAFGALGNESWPGIYPMTGYITAFGYGINIFNSPKPITELYEIDLNSDNFCIYPENFLNCIADCPFGTWIDGDRCGLCH